MGGVKIDLSNKVALVTGGSRGIGFAIAQALAGAGAKVALLGRDGAKAAEAAQALGDGRGRGYACDVAQAAQVERVVATIEEEFDRIDVLVNNAGTTRDNRIINITSVVGVSGNKGQANYTASKAGLIGLTKSVSKELASRNVLVNAVAPGFIDTELTRGISPEARAALIKAIPLGRLGQAQDVAAAVLFLASDFASYITGQLLVVDGGMVL